MMFSSNKTGDDLTSLRGTVGNFFKHGAVFPKVTDEKVQALLQAAAKGDLKEVQDLIAEGTSINSNDAYGWTPLAAAAALGYRDCSLWLLDHGADNVGHGSHYNAPLSLAAKGAQDDIVAAILSHGPTPFPKADDGLFWAAQNNDQPMFDALLKAGANPKHLSLYIFLRNGEVAMARVALDAGADPNRTEGGGPLVYQAVSLNQGKILKMLLDHGADPAVPGNMGQTPLALAQKMHPEFVSMIEDAIKKSGHRDTTPEPQSSHVPTDDSTGNGPSPGATSPVAPQLNLKKPLPNKQAGSASFARSDDASPSSTSLPKLRILPIVSRSRPSSRSP